MKGRFLMKFNEDPAEGNIYADKSALVLDWLLREGIKKQDFSLREAAKEIGVSVGLVQRVFSILIVKGLMQTEGIRTAKKFIFKKAKALLESWLEYYSIIKQCKIWTYASAFSEKADFLKALKKSGLDQKVVLALHSAAEALEVKNTNLNTLEIYMLDCSIRPQLEKILLLEPQERGYDVLLVEPYYKNLLHKNSHSKRGLKISPVLLAFLDLYHFPLRGQEQAEFMVARIPELKRIYKNNGHS